VLTGGAKANGQLVRGRGLTLNPAYMATWFCAALSTAGKTKSPNRLLVDVVGPQKG